MNWGVNGLGATALLSLLGRDAKLHGAELDAPAASAKRAIHICLIGGLSHVDSFDYKPELEKMHGKSLNTNNEKVDIFFGKIGLLRKNDWEFKPRGESGLMISEMFPHIARHGDDLTVFRSMESKSANHTPGLFLANSGFEFNGFPSMGSWLSYGLGSENDSLPAYVVLNDERGAPNTGASTWSSAFLPSDHQGVVLRGGEQPVRDLFPPKNISRGADAATRAFVNAVNQAQVERSGGDRALLARLRSYELAAKMQASIPEVADLSDETGAVQKTRGFFEMRIPFPGEDEPPPFDESDDHDLGIGVIELRGHGLPVSRSARFLKLDAFQADE